MIDPKASTAEGVIWIVAVAIMGMLLGFAIGVTSDARHGARADPAHVTGRAWLREINRDREG